MTIVPNRQQTFHKERHINGQPAQALIFPCKSLTFMIENVYLRQIT